MERAAKNTFSRDIVKCLQKFYKNIITYNTNINRSYPVPNRYLSQVILGFGAIKREWLKLHIVSLLLTSISRLEYYVPKMGSVGSREEVEISYWEICKNISFF